MKRQLTCVGEGNCIFLNRWTA